jgi:hypothetical protein
VKQGEKKKNTIPLAFSLYCTGIENKGKGKSKGKEQGKKRGKGKAH